MKLSAQRGDPFYMLNNSNLLSKFKSPSQLFHNPQIPNPKNYQSNKSDVTPRHDKKQNGMVYGFGIQVSKIPTQLKERPPIKPPQSKDVLNSTEKGNLSKISTNSQKPRAIKTDVTNQWPPKPAKRVQLPRLSPISTVTGNKRRANSQSDITNQSKRHSVGRSTKLRSTSKEVSQDRTEESFSLLSMFQSEPRRDLVEIKAREVEEYMKRSLERENNTNVNNEVKSLNIVQRKVHQKKDSMMDFWETHASRKEKAIGTFLQKALHEVNVNNFGSGIQGLFQNTTPSSNGLEIHGQGKEREREKFGEKMVKGRRDEKEKEREKEKQVGSFSTSIIKILDKDPERESLRRPAAVMNNMILSKDSFSDFNSREKEHEQKETLNLKDSFSRANYSSTRSETIENRRMNVLMNVNAERIMRGPVLRDVSFERAHVERSLTIEKAGRVPQMSKESHLLKDPRQIYNNNRLDQAKRSTNRLTRDVSVDRKSGRLQLEPVINHNDIRKQFQSQSRTTGRDDFKPGRFSSKRQFESPRIEQYQNEIPSDDDLSLYDYLKAKKEHRESEDFEYDFIAENPTKKDKEFLD